MKYQQALIAWTPRTDRIRVGPLPHEGDPDWTAYPYHYRFTGGAAYIGLHKCRDATQRERMLFIEFHTIVVRDQVPVEAAHEAFLAIDEYRRCISPDIKGADHGPGELGGWPD